MAAPEGNQFWKARSKHGRDLIFSSPTVLWEAACEYFEWADNNPWLKSEAIKSGPATGSLVLLPNARPYTEKALFIFLDIDRTTWLLYKERQDFITITTRIEEIIYTQKFEGAAVGAFNPNIIARDLGLVDKSETKGEVTIKKVNEYTDEELAAIIANKPGTIR